MYGEKHYRKLNSKKQLQFRVTAFVWRVSFKMEIFFFFGFQFSAKLYIFHHVAQITHDAHNTMTGDLYNHVIILALENKMPNRGKYRTRIASRIWQTDIGPTLSSGLLLNKSDHRPQRAFFYDKNPLITNLFELFSWEGSFHGVSQRYLSSLDQILDNLRVVDSPKMVPVVVQTNHPFVNFCLPDRVYDRYNRFFRDGIYLLLVFCRIRRHCLP